MELNISVTPATPATPEARTVAEIWGTIDRQAVQLLQSYNQLRQLTGYTASGKNRNGLTTNEVFAAVEAAKPGNLGAQDLGDLAKVIKAVINYCRPGTITDDVPAATITVPAPQA